MSTPAKTKRGSGSIADAELNRITKLFVKPLALQKPPLVGLKDWLEDLFHTTDRRLLITYTRMEFQMPGQLYVTTRWKDPDSGIRLVRRRTLCVIRHDDTKPELVEIEVCRKDKAAELYHLTRNEWDKIKHHFYSDTSSVCL